MARIASAAAATASTSVVEDGELDLERRVGGAGDAALELGQLGGGEAHGVGHGLAVDEARR